MTYGFPAFTHKFQSFKFQSFWRGAVLSAALAAVTALPACNQTPPPVTLPPVTLDDNAPVHSSKTGAALELTHDYDGYTEPGTAEVIHFQISHAYPDSDLSVKVISPSDSVTILDAPRGELRTLTAGEPEDYMMKVLPKGETAQPISIQTSVSTPEGQTMRRTFTVDVRSIPGPIPKKSIMSGQNMPASDSSPEVIKMDNMQEEIKKHD